MGNAVLLSFRHPHARHALQLCHHVSSSGIELVLLTGADQCAIAFSLHCALQVAHVLSDLRHLG